MNLDAIFHEITQEHAPYLHKALDELCAKAGIAKPVVCALKPEATVDKKTKMTLDHLIGALYVDKPRIIFGERARRIFSFSDMSQPISEEIKAVMAHELSHIKHGDVKLSRALPIRFLSPFAGMAAAMAGFALYDNMKSANEKNGIPEDKQVTSAQLDAQFAQTEQKSEMPVTEQSAILLKITKYAAAAAAGLIAGQLFSKLYHNHIEYRADKFSADLMGSGEPLASALEKFRDYSTRVLGIKQPGILKSLFTWHPDVNKRIETLRGL